ncbi:MAG: ferrous iron transporter B [Proteobacteria bacterium]|nr:ferrous iron transporter B [Pseudomonadota bacterium]
MLKKQIALVGTPNAGKTALFNVLTHSHQRVANYSGVTVESAEADFFLPSGEPATLVDLPGAYSLRPYTEEENVLAEALKGGAFSGMILVVDATQPERAIRFLIEVLDSTDLPAVVALNMSDLANSRGFEFDLVQFAALLGVPVIPTTAVRKRGIPELESALEVALKSQRREKDRFLGPKREGLAGPEVSLQILSFYKKADELMKRILIRKGFPDQRSRKIDGVILHPVSGPLILILVLGVVFQLMFNLAHFPMDAIDAVFSFLQAKVSGTGLPPVVKSFLSDGVLSGVGGTLVFLPQIVILYSLILFLEDFGFMARAVFLLDHLMGKVGLHGRSFLPLLSSYACNVPGILATRAIESRSDRIITTLLIPLTTCSARIPVYTLLISAFVPNTPVLPGMRLQGLVMLGLYAAGLLCAFLMGGIFKRFLFPGRRPPLLIELPSYKRPSFRSLSRSVLYRIKLFLKRVGTVILAISISIWFLLSFPRTTGGTAVPVGESYAARIGKAIEPAIRPIGFDWRIGMALIPTLAAREVMVSTLATVYSVEEDAAVSNTEGLSNALKKEWSLATGLSLLVWFIFAPMCISTLATARRELRSTAHLALMIGYLFGLSYLASFLTYRFFS